MTSPWSSLYLLAHLGNLPSSDLGPLLGHRQQLQHAPELFSPALDTPLVSSRLVIAIAPIRLGLIPIVPISPIRLGSTPFPSISLGPMLDDYSLIIGYTLVSPISAILSSRLPRAISSGSA
ncbi:hypothetical protein B0H16DRAFT_1726419 [Mycena metata]|uniref:Uncharacterized protein n=1 Tax=Mycena metata TaxID=1033252 RepID=A0AAD7N5E5_9AGAR|nr:hypothetical protein B0H16DRAFT_1726419 [Mycena metata]